VVLGPHAPHVMRPRNRVDAVHLHETDPFDQREKVSGGLLPPRIPGQSMAGEKEVAGGPVVDGRVGWLDAHYATGSARGQGKAGSCVRRFQ